MIRCKWCNNVADTNFSEGDIAIWTDPKTGEEHKVEIKDVVCSTCHARFGDVPSS